MSFFHRRFLWRELWAGRNQLALFFLCVMLASVSLSVVSGWRRSVDNAMAEETRKGAGGDVVAFSTEPLSKPLLEAADKYPHIFTSEMFTVALAPKTDVTLFSKLKAVDPGYPYYGEVPLQSGRNIHEALKTGVVVEKRALERLGIQIGDQVKIGTKMFQVTDVALSEPDRPLGMWGVSPRIFISYENLDKTELVRPGSYLERRIHIKLPDPNEADQVAEALRKVAVPDQERVETWQHPPVNMERYVENFFTFLDLMAVLAVTLGGLGMQSTLSAWLGGREQTIATVRSLGGDLKFVISHYAAMVGAVTVIGFGAGLSAAGLVLRSSGEYLTQMLPVKVTPMLSVTAAGEAGSLCLFVAACFAAWPLYLAGQVRPAVVLRKEIVAVSRRVKAAFAALLTGSIFVLLMLLIADLKRAGVTLLVLLGVAAVTGAASYFAVGRLKKLRPRGLALRTALGSWRSPEAKTELVVFVVSTCLAVLYTAVLCEEAVRQSWVESMPPDTPNIFFLDIQPPQAKAFEEAVGSPVEMFANLRVRAQEINGKAIDRSSRREYWKRDGRGKLDANPTLELPDNDSIVEGGTLYTGEAAEQVSVRDDIAKGLGLHLGDTVTFGVQGVPLTAKVSSIRHSERKGFKPSFELLFPPALVEGAPSSMFASARLPEDEIGPLQSKLAKLFPGIVSMDLSLTIKLITERLMQMASLVQYFLASGLVAGVLILVSTSLSSRERRAREAAYYKILGAQQSFLNRVLWYESGILGLLCSGLGLLPALAVTWGVCRWRFEVPFPQAGGWIAGMLLVPTVALALLGWAVGRKAVVAKPAGLLREG